MSRAEHSARAAFAFSKIVRADRAGPEVLASGLLHELDLPEEIDELLVRLPGVGHADETSPM